MSDDKDAAGPHDSHWRWYLRGSGASVSIPGLILAFAFVGFASLAREAGLTIAQTIFMTGIVWALPAKVVLIGAILSGSGLPAAALAVSLSSIRLMPMVVTIVPEMRGQATRKWVLYLLSHFVAVTSWVIALERLPHIPREMRTAFYAGLGSTLIFINMAVVAAVFLVAESLPPSVSAALFLLTPMYFLTSLWASARERASHVAMVLGIMLGPIAHLLAPEYDLLAAGLIGGGAAYAFHLVSGKRPS